MNASAGAVVVLRRCPWRAERVRPRVKARRRLQLTLAVDDIEKGRVVSEMWTRQQALPDAQTWRQEKR